MLQGVLLLGNRRIIGVALSLVACVAAPAAVTVADMRRLDIPPGDLSNALLELGRQARITIVFPKAQTENLHSPGVRGTLPLLQALEVLIGEHCLTVRQMRTDLVAVRAGCRSPESVNGVMAEPRASPDPQVTPPGVEEIIVSGRYLTGSRIRNPNADDVAQVDVISRAEIELSGSQAVGELLRYLPAVAGNSTSTLISNGGDGTATVTLRGLPASNTLVLINGRRSNHDGLFGTSVDLNTIPIGLVERVEILKDGASSIYGSDAIAGVVNVITRGDLHGARFSAYMGQSTFGDRGTVNMDASLGRALDGATFAVGASLYDQTGVLSRDRELSRTADDRPRGGIDKRSSAMAPARIMLSDGTVVLRAGEDGADPGDFRPATDDDRYDYRVATTSIVPSRRWSVFGNAHKDLDRGAGVYLETMFTDTRARNTLAPTPLFTGFETVPLDVAADNPFNPFDVALQDVRRRIVELQQRRQENRSETWRLVAGTHGKMSAADWDLSFTLSQSQASESLTNLLDARRTQTALDASCADPCVPMNLFGPPGSITPEMLEYAATDAVAYGKTRLRIAALTVDFPLGSLPGGKVEVVSGVEFRDESLETRPDDLISSGTTIGGATYSRASGTRDVFAAYAEANLPLAADRPFIRKLEINVAGRISQYSDFGRSTTPKVALTWQPNETLTLRWSVADGFRAPTLNELYSGTTGSFESINDPCSHAPNVAALPGCVVQSDPTLTQILTLTSGNPVLEAENAKTQNVGIVWRPGTRLALTGAYYRIRERGVVDVNAQFIVNENAHRGTYPDRVVRDGLGNITRVLATHLNIGRRVVSGFDLTARYDVETPRGRFRVSANATRIREFKDEFDPGSVARNQAGTFSDEASSGNGALPEWKANVGLGWSRGPWQAAYTVHFVGGLTEVVPVLETPRRIDAWRVHEVHARYLGRNSAWLDVSIGVNNLFNEPPPFSAAAFNDSYDARTYDITGRYYYVQLRRHVGG